MSISDWSMDVAILSNRIQERMSFQDYLSDVRFMTGVFAALTILCLAFIAWHEIQHRKMEKRLKDELDALQSVRLPAHDEHDAVDDSFYDRRAA
jgi:hypothetical protein